MKVLAIDPGSALGWATDATGRLEWGTEDFHIKGGESSGNRWRRFGTWLECASMGCPPNTFLTVPGVDLIVYERSVFMTKARAAAEIAAGFTTRLEEHCERHGIALQPVAVQTLKAFALPKVKRKKGDPKMDRSKAAMIAAAERRLVTELGQTANPYGIGPEGLLRGGPLTEHEADSLHLLWWAKENCK